MRYTLSNAYLSGHSEYVRSCECENVCGSEVSSSSALARRGVARQHVQRQRIQAVAAAPPPAAPAAACATWTSSSVSAGRPSWSAASRPSSMLMISTARRRSWKRLSCASGTGISLSSCFVVSGVISPPSNGRLPRPRPVAPGRAARRRCRWERCARSRPTTWRRIVRSRRSDLGHETAGLDLGRPWLERAEQQPALGPRHGDEQQAPLLVDSEFRPAAPA